MTPQSIAPSAPHEGREPLKMLKNYFLNTKRLHGFAQYDSIAHAWAKWSILTLNLPNTCPKDREHLLVPCKV